MVTTEQWTNGVLTSILLRVGSSGGGLPDALQVLRFAGRRYFLGAHIDSKFFSGATVLFRIFCGFLGFAQRLSSGVRLFPLCRILSTAT